jgi:hypothetical protein
MSSRPRFAMPRKLWHILACRITRWGDVAMIDPPTSTEPTAAPASKADLLQLPALIDATVAIVLACVGLSLVYVAESKDRPQWGGFVLIGLAALLYLMRGQVITKLSLTKDGVALETAQTALRIASETSKTANQNSKIIDQQLATGGKRQPVRATLRAESDSQWSHPALDKERETRDIVVEDPQSGQWGEASERNGRRLVAEYAPGQRGWVNVTLKVTSTDATAPLTQPVRFHLHDTFHPPVETVEPMNGVAQMSRLAWGAFTVGAEVANEPESYLELDLAHDPRAPEGWKAR